MSLIYNERMKLAANNLDRLSTALVVVGVLGKTFDFTPGAGLFVPMLSVAAWIFSLVCYILLLEAF